jgi:hypothetical protein
MAEVHVDLPNHWAVSGETIAARALGDDMYELLHVPFYAYDLNRGDHVVAHATSADLLPEIDRVVHRSGHRTLRVLFFDAVSPERRIVLLDSLVDLHVSYACATEKYYALDVAPEADIGAVRARLDVYEEDSWLQYETCEPKVEGSFDDAPA